MEEATSHSLSRHPYHLVTMLHLECSVQHLEDVRDQVLETELDLQQALIQMIPIPGGAGEVGGQIIRKLLVEFLSGFSLRALIFLLDMVLPQLDAYHTGRQMQHLQPWISVALAQGQAQGQSGSGSLQLLIMKRMLDSMF